MRRSKFEIHVILLSTVYGVFSLALSQGVKCFAHYIDYSMNEE